MKRFKSYIVSNETETDIKVDTFFFPLVDMREADVKETVTKFIQWAIEHQRQNHRVTLVGYASEEIPLLNELK